METLTEDDDDDGIIVYTNDGSIGVQLTTHGNDATNFIPALGGSFSALTKSMLPQDIISRIHNAVCFFI